LNGDGLSGKPFAPLSASLLARKGAATAAGFAGAPGVAPPPAAPRAAPPARRKILVVEDDLLNRTLMTDLFEAHGYDTLQAEDGEAALDVARASGPDLIVLDIQLPKLSGVDVVERLKSDSDLMNIPVIAVSAMLRSHAETMIGNAGFDGFLAKPFSVQSMLLAVSRLLH